MSLIRGCRDLGWSRNTLRLTNKERIDEGRRLEKFEVIRIENLKFVGVAEGQKSWRVERKREVNGS